MTATRWLTSSRRSSNSSAMRSNGSTPMPDTAATTRRQITSSKSTHPNKNLHIQTKATGDPTDQTRDATPRRRRARHRPSQGRSTIGPQLSRPPPRRLQQRRPRRRGLQLPPPDQVAQDSIAPFPGRALRSAKYPARLKRLFFTDDGYNGVIQDHHEGRFAVSERNQPAP